MKLHANVFGEGVPFLVLHGFLGMSDNWKTIAKKIAAEGYEMHLIDQRNHGRSPHSDAFSYELMAADLHEYCQENELQKVLLLGHSMGGKTAMLFAAKYPEYIQKLMIADIAPKYYPPHHQGILEGLQSLDFEVLKTRGAVDAALSAHVPEAAVRMFLMKNLYWEQKEQLGLRMHLSSLMKNVAEIGAALPEALSFKGDTLFLKGNKSHYIMKRDEAPLLEQFPNAVIAEIENAGHWLHAENPSSFLDRVLEFVKK